MPPFAGLNQRQQRERRLHPPEKPGRFRLPVNFSGISGPNLNSELDLESQMSDNLFWLTTN
jgi:hypothetical protein